MSLSRHARAISRRVPLCILLGQGLTIITMHTTPPVLCHMTIAGESSASWMGESWKESLNTTNTIPWYKYKFSEKTGANWQISPESRSGFDLNLILFSPGTLKNTIIWSYWHYVVRQFLDLIITILTKSKNTYVSVLPVILWHVT